jgi:hypothetical protein
MCTAGMSNTDSKIEAVAATNPSVNSRYTEEELLYIFFNECVEYPLVI